MESCHLTKGRACGVLSAGRWYPAFLLFNRRFLSHNLKRHGFSVLERQLSPHGPQRTRRGPRAKSTLLPPSCWRPGGLRHVPVRTDGGQ
jgi:hypothetical protein